MGRDRVVEINMTDDKFEFYDSNELVCECSNKESLFKKICELTDYYNNELTVGVYFTVR